MANAAKPGDIDPHALSTRYPEASAIFAFQLEPLETVKNTAIVVLDTNALLVPYRTGRGSLQAIRTTYERLVAQKRLIVPAQVAREFAHQRAEHLKNTYKQLSDRQNLSINTDPYPLFEGMTQYTELRAAETEVLRSLGEYRKAVARLLVAMRGWGWNDPVSSLYAEVLVRDVIAEPAQDPEKLLEELDYRYVNRIPPGFKDEKKPDGGIGDLLIWKTVLHVGEQRKTHVIFVSGDEKSDWWYRSDGTALYPRFELVDEFRRTSGGRSLHVIAFDRLLELCGASKEVVEEVRREQRSITAAGAPGSLRDLLEEAVEGWLNETEFYVQRGEMPHFRVGGIQGEEGPLRPVYVYPVGDPLLVGQKLDAALAHAQQRRETDALIVFGARRLDSLQLAETELRRYMTDHPDALRTASILLGRITRIGRFKTIRKYAASSIG